MEWSMTAEPVYRRQACEISTLLEVACSGAGLLSQTKADEMIQSMGRFSCSQHDSGTGENEPSSDGACGDSAQSFLKMTTFQENSI
jgi:hypothetical protein